MLWIFARATAESRHFNRVRANGSSSTVWGGLKVKQLNILSKTKAEYRANKHRVDVSSPLLSPVRTTWCRGTTSQQRGCTDPRLKLQELFPQKQKNDSKRSTSIRKWKEGNTNTQIAAQWWRKTCKLHHRCIASTTGSAGSNGRRTQVGLWCRCDAVNQHAEAETDTHGTLPWNAFYLRGNETKISPMYWMVPHIVNARPPRLSRCESPKSERRTWPETKHTRWDWCSSNDGAKQEMFLQESSIWMDCFLLIDIDASIVYVTVLVLVCVLSFIFCLLWPVRFEPLLLFVIEHLQD